MATWPASLPQKPRPETLAVSYAVPKREFQTDIPGPAIRRKVGSTAFKTWSGTYVMNTTQLAAFWTFYLTTVNFGVDTFTMTDPDTGASVTAEFVGGAPEAQMISANSDGGLYNVPLSFMVRS